MQIYNRDIINVPNKNKTKHPKCIVKSTKIPKIYFSQRVLTYTYKENPFLRKGFFSTSTCFRIGIKIITQPTNTTIPPTKMDFAVKQRGR